jgi:hypothetical protein
VPGQGGDQGIEGGDARHVQRLAAGLEKPPQVGVDNCVQDDPRRVGDFLKRPAQLALRSDQSVDMLDGKDMGKPGANGPCHGVQSFAGRVRNQVNMEIGVEALGRCHGGQLLGQRERRTISVEAALTIA